MLQQIATREPDYRVNIDPDIFNPVYLPYLNNMSRIQIFYGGASSGKSVFAVGQRTVIDLMMGGRNYLVCRQVGKTIRRSVFNEIQRTINQFGVSDLFDTNKSEFTVTCANGYQAFFVGLDDVEKVKSIVPEQGALTDIVIEEATETDKNTVKSLMRRQRGGSDKVPKRLTMLFNPILQDHWIFTEYFAPYAWKEDQTTLQTDNLSILKTTFLDNKFLTEQDREDLLSETDKYFRDVYTLGNWGILGNVIFTNWSIEDLSSMIPIFDNTRNGLDFGFASDPAAIGRSHWDKKHKTIYCFDEFYERDMTNDQLATEALKMCGNELIVCDSSEPKSIKELKNDGVNAVGAIKGADSVLHGIQWLRGCKIIVHKDCIHWQNELRQYKWKEGLDGKPVSPPKPVDRMNHLIDGGLRYAYEKDALEIPVKGRQWNG